MAGGNSDKMLEWYLFTKDGPDVIEKPSWEAFWKLRRDPHIWFQIVVPTLMMVSLIMGIFRKYLSLQTIVPLFLLVIMLFATLCEYLPLVFEKMNEEHKEDL